MNGMDPAGWEVVEVACEEARRTLGPRLASAYAIGSLAHGGFSAAASDIDVAFLVEPGESAAPAIEEITARTEAIVGYELARRLSIFHAPWPLAEAPAPPSRFPAIDRLDLLEHGHLVFGEDRRAEAAVPAIGEVREEAVRFSLSRWDPDEVAAVEVGAAGVRGASKAVLAPVRLWWLVETGRVVGNEEAVTAYLEAPGLPYGELVAAALEWRRRGAIEDVEGAQRMVDADALDLYARILVLLAGREGLPAADELAALAGRFERTRIGTSSGR